MEEKESPKDKILQCSFSIIYSSETLNLANISILVTREVYFVVG